MGTRQTTPEGEALIAAELAAAASSDPPPKDAPFTESGSAGKSADEDKPRRGRPPGSKNGSARPRRTRVTKLDEISEAAGTVIERGALLASFAVMRAPMAPERKMVWLEDASIVSSPRGKEALVGSLRFACEKNSRIANFCTSLIEASAYTGIGATVVFGLVLPIAINHGVFKNVPAPLLAMMQDDGSVVEADSPFAENPE